MSEKILIVEDDAGITAGLSYSLTGEGYQVQTAGTMREAREILKKESFDLCLLDLSLPDGSGYDICREIKKKDDMPVIFLTACDEEVNVVMGLDMGADDYITKPFRVRELISRIRTVLRRCKKSGRERLLFQAGGVTVSPKEAKVYRNGQEVFLSPLEYRLLLTLFTHEGQTLTRNQLLEGIWDIAGNYVNDNTLTVYIKRLREKLEEDPGAPRLIVTVRGVGYRIG